MHTTTLTALTLTLLTSLASAQIPGLPTCAASCVGDSFGSCNSLDVQCICSNTELLSGLSCCVSKACSKEDQDKTLQFANSLCAGQGVSNLPTAATCAGDAAASTTAASSQAQSSAASTESITSSASAASASASEDSSSTASAEETSSSTEEASSSASETGSETASSTPAASTGGAEALAVGLGGVVFAAGLVAVL